MIKPNRLTKLISHVEPIHLQFIERPKRLFDYKLIISLTLLIVILLGFSNYMWEQTHNLLFSSNGTFPVPKSMTCVTAGWWGSGGPGGVGISEGTAGGGEARYTSSGNNSLIFMRVPLNLKIHGQGLLTKRTLKTITDAGCRQFPFNQNIVSCVNIFFLRSHGIRPDKSGLNSSANLIG